MVRHDTTRIDNEPATYGIPKRKCLLSYDTHVRYECDSYNTWKYGCKITVMWHVSTLGCLKKALFWASWLASKYKVTCHVRNRLTRNGSPTLRFGPLPRVQWTPNLRVKTSKLSHRVHRMLIRKLLTRRTVFKWVKMLFIQYLEKYWQRGGRISRPFYFFTFSS